MREYITRKFKTMFVKLVNVCMYLYVIVNDYKIKYEYGKKRTVQECIMFMNSTRTPESTNHSRKIIKMFKNGL